MKKAFTLAELLGVIVVLGILALVAFPPIINQLRKSQSKINESTKKIIYSATEVYMDENRNDYPMNVGTSYCILIADLVEAGKVDESVEDNTNGEIRLSQEVRAVVKSVNTYTFSIVEPHECSGLVED